MLVKYFYIEIIKVLHVQLNLYIFKLKLYKISKINRQYHNKRNFFFFFFQKNKKLINKKIFENIYIFH